MPAYRVELASSNRAVCRNKECKDAKEKILKGELRFGTWVMIPPFENGSWHWKHWGCVTPKQLSNWWTDVEGDIDLIDGYEEMPADLKAKIQRALEQGHVDDEDFNGDVQMNTAGNSTRMRLTKTKKKELRGKGELAESDEESGAEDENGSPKKPPPARVIKHLAPAGIDLFAAPAKKTPKGRKRAVKDESGDDGDGPAPKKARVTKKKAVKKEYDSDATESEEEAPASKKARATKKSSVKRDPDSDAIGSDEEITVPKKTKTTKKKSVKQERDSDATASEEEITVPKKARATKTKAVKNEVVKKEEDSDGPGSGEMRLPPKAKTSTKTDADFANGVAKTKSRAGKKKADTPAETVNDAEVKQKATRGRKKKAAA